MASVVRPSVVVIGSVVVEDEERPVEAEREVDNWLVWRADVCASVLV